MILLYNDPSGSFFIMYFKSMHLIFKRGFFLLLLFNLGFSLWVLNVISSFIIHEVIHLYFARTYSGEKTGFIALNGVHFFARVPNPKTKKGAVLTYLTPSVIGLIFSVLFMSSSCKEIFYLPWAFNVINFMPFSTDMRALIRNFRN